jgi:hypothetical protein
MGIFVGERIVSENALAGAARFAGKVLDEIPSNIVFARTKREMAKRVA